MISLSSFFISDALAQNTAAAASAPQGGLVSFLPLVLIFVVFYFLLIRPQQKKAKEHQEMINNLKVHDKIYTTSGILGVIKEIDQKENLVEIEIAKDVTIKVLRGSIGELAKKKEEKEIITKKSKK